MSCEGQGHDQFLLCFKMFLYQPRELGRKKPPAHACKGGACQKLNLWIEGQPLGYLYIFLDFNSHLKVKKKKKKDNI